MLTAAVEEGTLRERGLDRVTCSLPAGFSEPFVRYYMLRFTNLLGHGNLYFTKHRRAPVICEVYMGTPWLGGLHVRSLAPILPRHYLLGRLSQRTATPSPGFYSLQNEGSFSAFYY